MKGVLVDTNVVSEIRKGPKASPQVRTWFAENRDDVFLSVLVTGEIRRGIESIRRRDASAAGALEKWLRRLEGDFEERILSIDGTVADRWGRLMADCTVPVVDGLMAATALVHGLTLATRSIRDVRRTGVPCVNPFDLES